MWIHILSVIVMEIIDSISNTKGYDYLWLEKINLTHEELKYVILPMNITNIIYCLVFFVGLTMLVWVHINNLLLNKTTFERFNLHKNRNNRITSSVG